MHSGQFLYWFNNLPPRKPTDPVDRIEVDEDPSKFGSLLDVVYKGATLNTPQDFQSTVEIIDLARKYGMTDIKTNFQGRLLDGLPTSAGDALTSFQAFDRYYKNPGLAAAVLEHGGPDHRPWALYILVVQQVDSSRDLRYAATRSVLASTAHKGNAYSYSSAQFGAYQATVRSLVHWNSQFAGFFRKPCKQKGAYPTRGSKCTRPDLADGEYDDSFPLYISPHGDSDDPLRDMVMRITDFEAQVATHGKGYYNLVYAFDV
ncbi:hypothetical protein FRC09_018639 [Ceratobasidium sp. 395]|nr:hypothetical protein FRC09_018639 [Ceratobasidium sp. 395]